MAGGATKALRAPAGPAEAYLRMLVAVGKDLAAAVGPGGERDPFERRDPGYIERTLPALRLSSRLYFRADVRGLEVPGLRALVERYGTVPASARNMGAR